MIQAAKALKAESYTEDSYKELMDIVAEAEKSADDKYIDKIQEAMKKLVNVEALKDKIQAAEKVDKELYTEDSYQRLEDALKKAKKLLKSGSAKEVKAATEELENARRALVQKTTVDVEGDQNTDQKDQAVQKLKDKIQAAEKVDKKLYTEDSYQRLEDALKKAKKLLKSGSEKEVKEATEELENACRALVQKTTVDVGGNQNNAGQNTDQKGQAVQTGDEGNLLPIVLVMVACIAIITVVIIRRKRK